ncbi:hypothetical protein DVH05_007415 [Phytophthora capsici]|nr:hypothetical protein DVH05_007415 [Phytophthora capsici]
MWGRGGAPCKHDREHVDLDTRHLRRVNKLKFEADAEERTTRDGVQGSTISDTVQVPVELEMEIFVMMVQWLHC